MKDSIWACQFHLPIQYIRTDNFYAVELKSLQYMDDLEWIKMLGETWPIYSIRSPSLEKATGESSKKSQRKDEEST